MKKTLFSFVVPLISTFGMAQETVGAAGGDNSSSVGSTNYTIGQVTSSTNTGSTGSVAQGVQQPFEIQTVLGVENFNINLQMSVYPNPATNLLQLEVKNTDFSNLSYQLVDLNGRLIANQKISTEISTIKMEEFSTAVFLLKVLDDKKEIKTFKVIKQ